MPLIYVQRYGQATLVGGTQYIKNGQTLFFGNTANSVVIELDPAAFTQAGTYNLFDFSAGTFNKGTYPTEQAALDAVVSVSAADLIGLAVVPTPVPGTTSGLIYDAATGTIKVTLTTI